jgi:hypothetical protein
LVYLNIISIFNKIFSVVTHLSILGIFHTIISVIALLLGFYALLQKSKIDPSKDTGRLYSIFTVITCLTALPVMKTGHPTAGHALAVIILALLPIAVYARSMRPFRRNADYVQTVLMTTTLFLSVIPAVTETLTRIPPDNPVALGPDSLIIQAILLVLFILYLVGIAYQVSRIKARKRLFRKPASIADAV